MPFCFLSPLNYPGNLFLFCLLIHLEKLLNSKTVNNTQEPEFFFLSLRVCFTRS